MRIGECFRYFCAALMAATLATSTSAQAQAQAQVQAEAKSETPLVPDQVSAALRFGDFAELERLYGLYGRPGVRSPLTGTERVKHF
jgi:hypothetical protein